MLSPADYHLIRRDIDLLGLRLMLDTDAFAEAIVAQFPHVNLSQVKRTYIRYKPATSCIVSYELMIAQKTVLAYAKAVTSAKKLDKYSQRPGIIQDFGIGRTVFRREGIIFSVLPNDNALKRLPNLFDPQFRQEWLQKLLSDRPDLSQATLRALRYKPERRYVAQLSVGEQGQAVVKAYTSGNYQQALINANAFESIAPLQIVPELGHSSRDQFLVFPWIDGSPLSALISTAKVTWEKITQTGIALAQLHQQHPQHLNSLSRSDEAKNLLILGSDLSWLYPQWKNRIQVIAVQLSTALLNARPINFPIHGDFNAEQVLLSPNTNDITFIDFDRAVCSDPATDLGSFIAKLIQDELRGVLSAEQREQIAAALIAGYRTAALEPISDDQIQLYTAIGLLRLGSDPFRYCEFDWLEKIDAILCRIEQLMNRLPFDRFHSSCPA
ncbi:aminoglycoside phosphotransferase family protein [Chlorogloeopsis sp. ULAP01]|uniref:aminoglycoside phosphotransferase family protein n=1 Tax=Chlorogloeopsis sp. ULAP01 TaxID=3056483 RepID=UPI0025AAA210|nr:aminoglycoside phosphotransferase family protein [Chlorogloeopsis sp. ULAP01]MDM9382258.1 aminoglycoside phosphotransferase family protein [Chlorogloeopsis sp. ULAP01]